MSSKNQLTDREIEALFQVLRTRFESSQDRLQKLNWGNIRSLLEQNLDKLWSIYEMEKTGGEPNLLNLDSDTKEYIFCDFSKESPAKRRSLCYDRKALESRKKNKPANSAKDLASKMGIELMNEVQYKKLQSIDEFDTKTSSWLETPEKIRSLGGAIFGDFRFGQTFIYHNGADSYYAARGFRGILRV